MFAWPIPRVQQPGDRFEPAVRLYLTLCTVIWACRLYALYQSHDIWSRHSWLYTGGAALVAASDELVVAAALSLLYWTSGLARSRRLRVTCDTLLLGAAILVVVLNIVNAELLAKLGAALTLPLLQYSDVFRSEHGRAAIWSWTSREALLLAATLIVVAALLHVAAKRLLPRVPRMALLAVLAAGTVLVVLAGAIRAPAPAHLSKSGTLAFAASLRHLGDSPFDEHAVIRPPFTVGAARPGIPRPPTDKPFRNVVLIILESAAAQYLDQYGGRHQITPNLLANESIVVRKAYAQSTSSTVALHTFLTGRYPWVAPLDLSSELAHATSVPMLPGLLAEKGIRSGFFHSSDVRFGGADQLLASSGYKLVQDYRGRKCGNRLIADVYSSLGNADECTFAHMLRWIEDNRSAPFFATLWTFQSHYPYYSERASADQDAPRAQRERQRYLDALAAADRLIGATLSRLQALGLANETLVVVTSDHGQQFGERGSFGNGISTYEESVRIPLLLISPRLRRTNVDRLVGQIDIAPTIADALGVAPPPSWDGISLFAPAPERPIYFVSTTAELVIGYRLGSRKIIANLATGSTEIYDLGADPHERRNLAPVLPASDVERQRQWLAAWATQVNARWASDLRVMGAERR